MQSDPSLTGAMGGMGGRTLTTPEARDSLYFMVRFAAGVMTPAVTHLTKQRAVCVCVCVCVAGVGRTGMGAMGGASGGGGGKKGGKKGKKRGGGGGGFARRTQQPSAPAPVTTRATAAPVSTPMLSQPQLHRIVSENTVVYW